MPHSALVDQAFMLRLSHAAQAEYPFNLTYMAHKSFIIFAGFLQARSPP